MRRVAPVDVGSAAVIVDDKDLRDLAKGRAKRLSHGRGHVSSRIRSWINSAPPAVFLSILVTLLLVLIFGPGQLLWRILIGMIP